MKNLMVLVLLRLVIAVMPGVAAEPKTAAEAMQKGNVCFDNSDYDGAVAAYSVARGRESLLLTEGAGDGRLLSCHDDYGLPAADMCTMC